MSQVNNAQVFARYLARSQVLHGRSVDRVAYSPRVFERG